MFRSGNIFVKKIYEACNKIFIVFLFEGGGLLLIRNKKKKKKIIVSFSSVLNHFT